MANLPASCAQCAYFQPPASRCRRHAPGTALEELELTYWPTVKPTDRCGAGQAVMDGTETTSCGRCIHWLQPGGVGIRPDYRQGLSVEWWEQSGYCTRFAPGPSNDDEKRGFWRCTHQSDRCGDGEEAEVNDEDVAPDLLTIPAA